MAGEASNEAKNQGFGAEGSFASKLVQGFEKTFGLQNEVNKEARKAVAKLGTQVKFTSDLINKNRKKLEEIAVTDSEVANFLERFDGTNFDKLEELRQAVLQGNMISKNDGKFLASTFQELETTLGGLGIDKLEANLGDVLNQLRKQINSDELDRATQREFLNDFVKVLDESKEDKKLSGDQLAALELLKEEQEKGFNFQEEQLETLNDIFQFFEESKIGDIKQLGTLDDLSRKFSSFLIGQDELKQALEDQRFDGEALVDILKDGLESELGTGITDLLLGALGLPGLATALKGAGGFAKKAKNLIFGGFSKIFGKSGVLTKIFGKGGFIGKAVGTFGKFFGQIGKVFGGVSKIAGPVLKGAKFLKVIPVVGTVIAAISGIFDAVSGFFNAGEIAGKAEEFVTFGDRIQASISSFISGLTFGLVEAETIFQGINKGIDFLFGEEGIFSSVENFLKALVQFSGVGLVTSLVDKLMGGSGELFGEEGVFSRFFNAINSFGVGIGETIDQLLNFDFKSLLPESLANLFSDDEEKAEEKPEDEEGGFFNKVGNFFGGEDEVSPPPTGRPTQTVARTDVGDTATTALSREDNLRSQQQGGGAGQAQVIPVPVGGAESGGKTPQRRNQVDDMQLSAINIGLLD